MTDCLRYRLLARYTRRPVLVASRQRIAELELEKRDFERRYPDSPAVHPHGENADA